MLVNPYLEDDYGGTYSIGIVPNLIFTKLHICNPSDPDARFVEPDIFRFAPDGKPLTHEKMRKAWLESELEEWEQFWEGTFSFYGVADNLAQVVEYLRPAIDNPDVPMCILVLKHLKSGQPAHDGFRAHKHGPYIGTHELTAEYLADEPNIDAVWTFSACLLTEGFYDPTSATSADLALQLVKGVR